MATQQGITTGLAEADVQDLSAAVRGQVITPTDDAYEDARKVWNEMIDRRPALIVRCAGVADVVQAVQFARSQNLPVAVRGGGHNVAGNASCDAGLVVDLSPMKGMRVDPVARTARAQGGITWHDFDHETQAFGLATTGGLISTTGIAGLTLGGGIGHLARKHGLSCDNLLSADVVTADGQFLTASPTQHEDLFWGLRGGGGNFGVVTSFEYQLHPLGPVLGGMVLHPAEKAREVLQFYRDFMGTAPDELNVFPAFITVPPLPMLPAALHGTQAIAIAACYAGDLAQGEQVIQPLRTFGPPTVDLLGPMPYTVLQSMFDAAAPPAMQNYWKSDYYDELSDGAIDVLLAHTAMLGNLFPLSTVHIYPMGGAIGRVAPEATAFPARGVRYNAIIAAGWPDPAQSEAHISWVRGLWEALRPYSTGGVYVNFLGDEGADRVRAAYGDSYDRLAALKTKYDPTNFFHLNQNIQPTA